MKNLFLLIMMLPFAAFSQIHIDEVGDGWKAKVDSALVLIKQTSPEAWAVVESSTAKIEFWIGDRSSTIPAKNGAKGTILIAVDEVPLGIYNIASVIVHESIHLHFLRTGVSMPPVQEEISAYCWELIFLNRVPNCPDWLKYNAIYQISQLQANNR